MCYLELMYEKRRFTQISDLIIHIENFTIRIASFPIHIINLTIRLTRNKIK